MTAASRYRSRALVLLEQKRHADAEQELRRALGEDPDDATTHALLALALGRGGALEEATREAEQAVRLAPHVPFAHYVLASVLADRNRFADSARAAEEAIRLDPGDPDPLALLAAVRHSQRQFQAAVDAADRALALDPKHAGALNVRSMALVMLGRRDEAHAGVEAALAEDPDDPVSHATRGWALLDQGDRERALEHFREALRLDPGQEWARRGIVEAMKARYSIYGLVLRYFLWMGKLKGRVQVTIWIGAIVLFRVLRDLARRNPETAIVIWPVLGLYLVFLYFTWTADALFNLLLRLDRFGRHALLPDQVRASSWVGGMLALALAGAVLVPLTGSPLAVALTGAALLLVVPLAATFQCDAGWPRLVMGVYTAVLAAAGLVGLAAFAGHLRGLHVPPAGLLAAALFLPGVVISTWVGALLTRVTVRR